MGRTSCTPYKVSYKTVGDDSFNEGCDSLLLLTSKFTIIFEGQAVPPGKTDKTCTSAIKATFHVCIYRIMISEERLPTYSVWDELPINYFSFFVVTSLLFVDT